MCVMIKNKLDQWKWRATRKPRTIVLFRWLNMSLPASMQQKTNEQLQIAEKYVYKIIKMRVINVIPIRRSNWNGCPRILLFCDRRRQDWPAQTNVVSKKSSQSHGGDINARTHSHTVRNANSIPRSFFKQKKKRETNVKRYKHVRSAVHMCFYPASVPFDRTAPNIQRLLNTNNNDATSQPRLRPRLSHQDRVRHILMWEEVGGRIWFFLIQFYF